MEKMSNLVWSRHIREERDDRMLEILLGDGLGEIQYAFPDKEKQVTNYVTSTGCLLICQGNFVITAYLLSFKQASALFNKDRIPQAIYNQIRKNYKRSTSIKKGKVKK